MKKFFISFVFLIITGMNFNVHAALTGIKTIPGDYPTISAAIADLNFQGVGSGGVIFNVSAGHTETASNLTISITANQPTSSNTVIFQKNGGGTNPLITAAPGISASYDGIIKFSGADYITFDAIDLVDPVSNTGNAVMEWGYALMRASTTDGSQHNVIKNCVITLQKISSLSYGIYIINRDTNGTVVAASDVNGLNSYNKLYGNVISNVYKGIVAISSSTVRDIDNEIGVNGQTANSITNWGGSTVSAEGIRCEGQINVKINNNIVSGGNGTANAVYGIIATLFGATASAPNYEISYNQVSVTVNSSSSATFGIRALATGDTVLLHHNTVENCNAAHSSSAFNGIVHDPTGVTNAAYIYNNIVRNNTLSGTGSCNLLVGSGTINYLIVHSNQVYGNQKTGASGIMNCIQTGTASLECDSNLVYNNSIPNSSGTSSSFIYGYINSSSSVREIVYGNTIYNLTVGGFNTSASSLVAGIRSNAASTSIKEYYGNQIYGLSGVSGSVTTGGVYGLYSSLSASTKIHENKIYDITNTGSTGTAGGCWVSSGSGIEIYNNFISEIKTPLSTNSNAVTGINLTSTTASSTIKVYYNSVYLSATGGATFGSSGISVTANATATTAALDMRNNIFINISTPGSTSGNTVAYRRSLANLANFSSSSDYNNFYAGSPSGNTLIFFDGTNGDQTLPQYQVRVSPRESNSKSVPVTFQNTVNGDLHLIGGSIGDINLLGSPVSGYSTDFDGNLRNASFPYKGADESTAFTLPTLNLTVNLEACSPMQDTVTVSIRNTINPFTIVESHKAYLSGTGSAAVSFANAVNGTSYYIVVNHRNSIATWSKSGGEIFTAGLLNYNFTTAAAQAYGNNMVLVSGKYSFYTGDVNQDEIVDAGDLSIIDNDAVAGLSGYNNSDLNCDSFVDATDLSYCDNNATIGVSVSKP
ncbi:MAG: hypothetical protein WBQ38_07595 [Ignavibacteria bacterium]|nr:hypothetical protein [Ignavibacteria bacterium]